MIKPLKKPEINEKMYKEMTPQQIRDLIDKLQYRELFGKKRSDDKETDSYLEHFKAQKLASLE